MAELPTGITQADLDRYAKLDKGVKVLEVERKALGDRIKEAFSVDGLTGKHTLIYQSETLDGSVVVTLNEQRRFSKETLAKLEEQYPLSEFPNSYKAVLVPEKLPKAADVDSQRSVTMTMSVDTVAN